MQHKFRTGSLFFAILFFCSQYLTAQVNSPYSRIGLGNIFPTSFAASNGMAGLTISQFSLTDIQFENPASYSFLSKAVFDVGLNADYVKLKTGTDDFNSGYANLSHIALGFSPNNKKSRNDFGFSTGIIPFSGFQYDIDQESETDTLTGLQSTNFRGTGMLYRIYLGAGYNYSFKFDSLKKEYRSRIAIGLNTEYLFGGLQNITVASFPEQSNSLSTKYIRDTHLQTGMVNFGIGYQNTFGKNDIISTAAKKDTLYTLQIGASYSPKFYADATQSISWYNIEKIGTAESIVDTLLIQNDSSGQIVIPAQFNAGLSFNNFRNGTQKTKFSIGADFTTSFWGAFEGFQYSDSLADSYRIKLGAEIIPDMKIKRDLVYRIGFYAGKSQIMINGEQLSDFGATFGIGIPIGIGKPYSGLDAAYSKLNIAIMAGRRGTSDIVQENYFKLNLGLNLNSIYWFQRRQLN